MKKTYGIAIAAGLITLGLAGCGQGGGQAEQEDTPEAAAYRYRHAVMTVVAQKMIPIGGMFRGEVPVDDAVFTKSAADLAAMAGMAAESFMAEGIPATSRAMPEIWTNWSDFEQKANDFQAAARAVADAAETGGFEAAKGLVQPLQQTCGGCHRGYRAPEEE